MSTEPTDSPTFDPSQRRLCPDGSCVGVIGNDGKCKICGTPDPGGPVETPAAASPIPTPEPEAGVEAGPEAEGGEKSAFDPKRRLCHDEACIGVLDSQGRCQVCGRPG